MEGKKVLWVVFSIALALVVILAAGLFLLRPRQSKSSEASGTAAPSLQGYDPYEYVRGTSAPPGLTPPSGPQPKVIVVGEPPPPERAVAEPAAPQAEPAAPSPLGRQSGLPQPSVALQKPPSEQSPQEQVVIAPPERGPPERAGAGTVAAKPLGRVPSERVPRERAVAATAPQVAQKPASAAKPSPQRAPAAARPKAVSVTEYWIQAGSFSSAARADEVSRRLGEQGLAARTTTRDLNGKTHFRVRVGPYTNKAEAEKFLGWIRELKGFETSYISMVASRRAMP